MEHGSANILLSDKLHNDWANEIDGVDGRDFAKFQIRIILLRNAIYHNSRQ